MNRLYIYIIVMILLYSCSSCKFFYEEFDDSESNYKVRDIILLNDSDSDIYVLGWWYDFGEYISVKTALEYNWSRTKLIPSDSCYKDLYIPKNIERNQSYQFIIFDRITIDTYSKEELVRKNIYDKLYVLSYDELAENDFLIIYSGKDNEDLHSSPLLE